jgi:hypothetical protein
MEQTIITELQALKERSVQPNDGIVGSLYKSWPQHFHIDFDVPGIICLGSALILKL